MRSVVMFFLCLELLSGYFASAQMRVHAINVGQGASTLIEFPTGVILIDAGGERAPQLLREYLDSFFMTRPDLDRTLACLYVTHPHTDHTSAIPMLIENYRIQNVVTDGLEQSSGSKDLKKLHDWVAARQKDPDPKNRVGYIAVTTDMIGPEGLTNKVIDPITSDKIDPSIRVLWGTSKNNPGWDEDLFRNPNNHSLAIRVTYGTSTVLITGDLGKGAGLSALMEKYRHTGLLEADLYMVGHHGSENGTTSEFLKLGKPRLAIISVGRHEGSKASLYHLPRKTVIDTLQSELTVLRPETTGNAYMRDSGFVSFAVSKAVYATAWDGNVIAETDSRGVWCAVNSVPVKVPLRGRGQEVEQTPQKPVAEKETQAEKDGGADLDMRNISVNKATVEDLLKISSICDYITPKVAQAIVSYRKKVGYIDSLDKLKEIKEIGGGMEFWMIRRVLVI